MQTKIKAIETKYKGYRFRSRTEARWAVFFDCCREPWEYEKEGYEFNGVKYLPDFWLPGLQLWVEIKGVANEKERKLVYNFSQSIEQAACMICGNPGDETVEFFANDTTDSSGGVYYEDNARWCWGERGLTLNVGFCDQSREREIWGNPTMSHRLPWFEIRTCNREPLSRPYSVARSSRFEHGETPKIV